MRHWKLKLDLTGRRCGAVPLALGLALASAPVLAQSGLPELPEAPEFPQSQRHPNPPLPNPYPFAGRDDSRAFASAKLVAMLGIHAPGAGQSAATMPPVLQMPLSPQATSVAANRETSVVVSATASEEAALADTSSVRLASHPEETPLQFHLQDMEPQDTVELGDVGDLRDPAESGSAALVDRLPEHDLAGSLIDAELSVEPPVAAAQPAPSSIAPEPTVLVTEASLPELPRHPVTPKTRVPELARLAAPRSLRLNSSDRKSTGYESVLTARSGRPAPPASTAIAEAASSELQSSSMHFSDTTETSINFSDSDDDGSGEPVAAAASAESTAALQLSDSLSLPPKATSLNSPRPMRVQIEGEPVVVVKRDPRSIRLAATQNATTQNATTQNATTQNATTENATTENAMPKQNAFAEAAQPLRLPEKAAPLGEASLAAAAPASGSGAARTRLASLVMERSPGAASASPAVPQPIDYGAMLRVGVQDALVLNSETPIAELSAENPELCQLIQTGAKAYSLIGLRPGRTRIALVSHTATGERSVEIREVTIDSATTAAAGLDGLAQEIAATLGQLYPNYAIEVDVVDKSLLVQGEVASENEAKHIIGFVRKTSLMPVLDRLEALAR